MDHLSYALENSIYPAYAAAGPSGPPAPLVTVVQAIRPPIFQAADTFVADAEQHDDMTLVVMRVVAAGN